MSEIKNKVENELKNVKSMCETMENAIKTHIDKGLDKVNTHELYEAIDIYKDLSEVKKNTIKSMYYMQIMEAMENSEYGEDYTEDGPMEKRYYDEYRYANGRFAPKGRGTRRGYTNVIPVHYRDMDVDQGRMYYSEPHNNSTSSTDYTDGYNRGYSEGQYRDAREGRSGHSRRSYMEAKETHKDKTEKLKELEKYMNELSADITEMIGDSTNEEKTILKAKLQTLANKVI